MSERVLAAARALCKRWNYGLTNHHLGNELRELAQAVAELDRPSSADDEPPPDAAA